MAIVLDSTVWLAFVMGEKSADSCAKWVEPASPNTYYTPSIVAYEVYRKMRKERGIAAAREVISQMRARTTMIALTTELAISAAQESIDGQLAMADAIVLTTAKSLGATLVTGDGHFEGKTGVEYIKL